MPPLFYVAIMGPQMSGEFAERLAAMHDGRITDPTPLQIQRAVQRSTQLTDLADANCVPLFVLEAIFISPGGAVRFDLIDRFTRSLEAAIGVFGSKYGEDTIRDAITPDMVRKNGTIKRRKLKNALRNNGHL